MTQGFPRFRPRAPWWGADLQTLRTVLRPPVRDLAAGERLVLPLADGTGDALACVLHRASPAAGPLAVLVHGLAGSSESAYVITTAAWLLARGHSVLRVNLRGAGASRPHCRLQYHAGRSEDLRDALLALDPHLRATGLLLVGFSLGGNMLLKFLAEHAAELPVVGAASVSAPIDLSVTARRMLAPRNRVYSLSLLRSLRAEALGPGAEISDAERRIVAAVRSIREFDERFVAPRNGYAGAEDYYAANAARRFMGAIRVPTLVISALDDPWIPGRLYTEYPWRENPCLVPLLSSGGGHVGFHDAASPTPWHARCIERFFAGLTPPAEPRVPREPDGASN